MILQCVYRRISEFFPLGWCFDRPILHFGGLTLLLYNRFAPASNGDVVNR